MKKLYFLLLTFLISAVSFGQVVISQAYGGGGNTGATYKNDFIELFNRGTSSVSLNGWSIQYASSSGTTWAVTNLPDFTLAPGQYFLLQQAAGSGGTTDLPTPDATGTIAMSGTNFKILLSNSTTAEAVACPTGSQIIDLVGFGSANCSEGTVAPVLSNTNAGIRINNGCGDSNNNSIDFTTGTPNPRNSSTAISICSSVPTPTINVSGAVSGMFYYEGNPPSSEKTFTVSGINLTANAVITAPANFEVSITSGSGFTTSLNLTPTTGTLDPTIIYVRLVSPLTANTYTGDVTVSSTGAPNKTVALTGLVSPANPLIKTTGSVSALAYSFGSGPSNEGSFSIEGLFLTNNITLTAASNFEISLTSGSGFGNSILVSQTGGTVVPTEIFVRLIAGLEENSYSGNITATSAGATDKTIAVSGMVNPLAVCVNVGDIIITEIMQNPAVNTDPAGEYIELYNKTASPIDIKGWVIKDDLTASESHTILSSLIIPANGYIVIGNVATPNGGITMNYTYANDISLGNGTDGIILECSSSIIDQVIWDGNFPFGSGISMELSTNKLDSVSNDSASNWGAATSTFGDGDFGTPGAANGFTLSTNQFETNNFKIYPNPTNLGYVNIVSKNNAKMDVSVFDILGKQVIKETLNNNRLNTSKLNAGVYIIKVVQDNATITKKLVIK